jgi:hypothetical protein
MHPEKNAVRKGLRKPLASAPMLGMQDPRRFRLERSRCVLGMQVLHPEHASHPTRDIPRATRARSSNRESVAQAVQTKAGGEHESERTQRCVSERRNRPTNGWAVWATADLTAYSK